MTRQSLHNFPRMLRRFSTLKKMSEIYNFKVKDLFQRDYDLAALKDKVVVVFNTASKCGFTPQLEDFEKLYKKHKDNGLVILAFPCNQV